MVAQESHTASEQRCKGKSCKIHQTSVPINSYASLHLYYVYTYNPHLYKCLYIISARISIIKGRGYMNLMFLTHPLHLLGKVWTYC